MTDQETIDLATHWVDYIQMMLTKRANYLRLENQADIKEALAFFQEVIASGDILNESKLRNMVWSPYNIRYGVNSLKGLATEVWSAIAWNQMGTKDKCLIVPSSKEEQVLGWDLSFSAPQWHYIYHGQTKTAYFYQDGTFTFYEDWKRYDPTIVNRLLLCDPKNNKGYCVDFPEFLTYLNEKDWSRTTKVQLNEIELLTNTSRFHTKRLKLN